MIIKGEPVDAELLGIKKSIAENLKDKNTFKSVNEDTANPSIELIPPVSMHNCFYVFKESSHVAECSRILADDIIYNEITLTPADDNADDHVVNQVMKINEFLNNCAEINELNVKR